MQYIIVQNKSSVLLGPIEWRPRFIQSEFSDLEVLYQVPPVEQGYIDVDTEIGGSSATGIEIFPIGDTQIPQEYDPLYHELAGPFWTYQDQVAFASYTLVDRPLLRIQQDLKSMAANERYNREIAGTQCNINGVTVSLETDRVKRFQYSDLLTSIGTNTVNWKFPEGFVSLDKDALVSLVTAVTTYVQDQFDWEKSITDIIDESQTLVQLKACHVLIQPSTTQNISAPPVSPGAI